MALEESTQILAIGGGKGGVGKSFVAAGLATAIAEKGKEATLIDLDLGGANLHTVFGIKTVDRGIGDFIFSPKSNNLADYATETGVRKLKLISGNGFIPGIANLTHQQKVRVLKAIGKLKSDYVILDLGAGTSYNVIDFFAITQSGIVVTVAEPTAILNAYEFLKNVLFRIFSRRFKRESQVMEVINSFKVNAGQDSSIHSLIQAAGSVDKFAADSIQRICEGFRPGLIINMSKGESMSLGQSLHDICENFLGVDLTFLGAVPQDDHVQQALLRMKPITVEFAKSPPSLALRDLARKCMAGKWMDKSGVELLTEYESEGAEEATAPTAAAAAPAAPKPREDHKMQKIIEGHKDAELSSLLASFLSEYSAQSGIRKEEDDGVLQQAREEEDASGLINLSPSDLLAIEPRIEPKVKLPRFIPVKTSAPPRRFFAFRFYDRHFQVVESLKRIRSIPESDNIALAVEQTDIPVTLATKEVGEAWAETGLRLVEFNQLLAADKAFMKALECLPGHVAALNNRAATLIALGRMKPAMDLLNEALRNSPKDTQVLFNLGLVKLSLGDCQEAGRCFGRASGKQDKASAAVFLNAYCLYFQKNYPEARVLFETITTQDVTDSSSRFNAGLCQLQEGLYAAAITSFSSVLFFSPEDAEALAARGLSHWYAKHDDEAFHDLSQAIKKQPANLSFRASRGAISFWRGRYDKAIEDIHIISQLMPENGKYRELLTEIRRRIGVAS